MEFPYPTKCFFGLGYLHVVRGRSRSRSQPSQEHPIPTAPQLRDIQLLLDLLERGIADGAVLAQADQALSLGVRRYAVSGEAIGVTPLYPGRPSRSRGSFSL